MNLNNRVALVTGASRGIGRAIVEAFIREGACVVLVGRSQEKGNQAIAELCAGEQAAFISADVRNNDDINRVVDEAISAYGKLDILVNNAGGVTSFSPLASISDDEWESALNWNLTSTFRFMRKVIPIMETQGYGRIINISSLEGKNGKAGLSAYAAVKHAINGLTKSVAKEVGTLGITVNAICPGLVLTDVVKEDGKRMAESTGITYEELLQEWSKESAIQRPCRPEEIAAMAALLASENASGITGALLSVDGGTANY